MRIIIAGGREFNDYSFLVKNCDRIISKLYMDGFIDENESIEIVSGRARGTDKLGEEYARYHNYSVTPFPAKWITHGNNAGYIRNTKMARYISESDNNFLIAFWDGKSGGTEHMINEAKRFGIDYEIIYY